MAVRVAALLALVLALGGAPAGAVIPSPEKMSDAVAKTNREAGRAEPLLLDVSLRIGEGEPVASGVLATHPTGLARLELKSRRGFVERHLLQGEDYAASRDGRLIERPRPFLPPIFLLQATSGAALRAALSSFGVAGSVADLGLAGDHDCYVFGGRVRGRDDRRVPSVWVDLESYDVVRIDRGDGVRFRFGPSADFSGIRAPRWIGIEAPGQTPVRLEIEGVAPANAPAAAFGMDWLTAPPIP